MEVKAWRFELFYWGICMNFYIIELTRFFSMYMTMVELIQVVWLTYWGMLLIELIINGYDLIELFTSFIIMSIMEIESQPLSWNIWVNAFHVHYHLSVMSHGLWEHMVRSVKWIELNAFCWVLLARLKHIKLFKTITRALSIAFLIHRFICYL